MSLAEAIGGLPDGVRCALTIGSGDLTVGELRAALARPSDARVLTTGEAAGMFGYSGDTWREWADRGEVIGAYRDTPEGMWRLPLRACEEHLARLQDGALHRRRKRGPWPKKGTAPQAARAGAEADTQGKVVRLRSETVGRRASDDERPAGRGLAG